MPRVPAPLCLLEEKYHPFLERNDIELVVESQIQKGHLVDSLLK